MTRFLISGIIVFREKVLALSVADTDGTPRSCFAKAFRKLIQNWEKERKVLQWSLN